MLVMDFDKMREKLKTLERTRHLMIWHDSFNSSQSWSICYFWPPLLMIRLSLNFTRVQRENWKRTLTYRKRWESPQVYIIARTYELDHAIRCPPVTFKERQEFVLQGPVSRARCSLNHNPNPFSNLSKDELVKRSKRQRARIERTTSNHYAGRTFK
ncbi:hypothetical protein QZH41_018853 [Actinostola sp. cb2023]|nr:hypothetical protein QZH41_018853 [Actinostola sp. cb2023]